MSNWVKNTIYYKNSIFNIQHHITAAYHPQSNGKAERMIQTSKRNVKKLQLDNHRDFSRALQIAVSAYWMVPHKPTGFSPFQLLYGRDPLMPEEILQTIFKSDEDYEIALSSHIQNMIELNQQAIKSNQQSQEKTKKWFNRKFVRKKTTIFQIGDLVLSNVKNRFKDLKSGQTHWMGPCEIVLERPGPLYDLSYKENNRHHIYYQVHQSYSNF